MPNSASTDVTITGTSSIPSSVALDNFSPTVHNLSLDSFSTLSISAANLFVDGPSLSNAGHVNVGSGSFLGLQAPTVNLTGGGTVNLNSASSEINGSNTILVNKDNTIQGQGNILNLSNFTNQATVNANVSGGTLSIGVFSGITNTGILEATGGGTLSIGSSFAPTVTNTNGTISTDGSSTVFLNNSIIIGGNLTSASGAEIHGINNAKLQGVTITAGSTYSIDADNNNYLTGDLNNKGTVLIGGSSGHSFLGLQASTVNLTGGGTVILSNANSEINGSNTILVNKDNTIQGLGTILNLTSFQNGGTVHPGIGTGAGILTVLNSYAQTSTGILDIALGGSSPGSGYSQLVVGGTASLAGTLNLSLLGGFTPTNGEQFVILTSSGLTGMFTDNVITVGNTTFDVSYSPPGFANDVVLNATTSVSPVPEPASLLLLGLGSVGIAGCLVRRSIARKRGK